MTLANLVDYHIYANHLKSTTRYSSCKKSMQEPTAGHCWKVGLLAIDLIEELNIKVNVPHAIKLALNHDICECGKRVDFDSYLVATGVHTKEEKRRSEENVMKHIASTYGRRDVYDLWKEYEAGETLESKFIRAVDKLEALLHIIQRGERGQNHDDADHIAFYADTAVKNFPALIPFLREMKMKMKIMYERQGFPWKPEYNYPNL